MRASTDRRTPAEWIGRAALDLLPLGLAAGMLLALTMVEGLSHDEHQFVAAGWLLGNQGLLPYRNFPFHHLPNLALLYAAIARLSSTPLLIDRLLSVAFGVGTLAFLYAQARGRLQALGFWPAWMTAVAVTVFLVLSPLFKYANTKAWNHALPTFLTLLAWALHLRARRGERPTLWLASGGLLGIAAGTRSTFLAVFVPFVLFALGRRGTRLKWRNVLLFTAGTLPGLAPSLLFAALSPWKFLYGNVIYPLQNTRYRELLLHEDAMDLPGKLAYFTDRVVLYPGHLPLALAGLWLGYRVLLRNREAKARDLQDVWLALGTALFLWIGGMVPTPSWYQYFYAPLPFAVLAAVCMLRWASPRPGLVLVAAGLLLGFLVNLRADYIRRFPVLLQPDEWVPVQVHAVGRAVADRLRAGRVLTLGPIFPIEGGLQIYPAFATGSLTWRVSPFMAGEPRRKYGVIAPEDLPAYLEPMPPAAVLVGFELHTTGFSLDDPGELELPLVRYALARGYRRSSIECAVCDDRRLYLWQPAPQAGR